MNIHESENLSNSSPNTRRPLSCFNTINLPELSGISLIDGLVQELLSRKEKNLSSLSASDQLDYLGSRTTILPRQQLLSKLEESIRNKSPLKVKLGVDATGKELHIGHAVPMIIASRFQRMGHQVQLVVGDFTAKIGDPSGRSNGRAVLTDTQVQENVALYKEQFKQFLKLSGVDLRNNTEWLGKMSLSDGFQLFSQMSLATGIQREDFRLRIQAGGRISQAEILYANLMGIDSVKLKSDVELGGVDQTLNLHVCREVMEIYGLEPEVLVTCPLIPGIGGSNEKMSKSLNNYIGLLESPQNIFGKVMSIPDTLLETYYKALTELSDDEWQVLSDRMHGGSLNPKHVKTALGTYLVSVIHDFQSATLASNQFDEQFSKRKYSELADLVTFAVSPQQQIGTLLVENKIISSNAEARRLFEAGAVQIVNDNDSSKVKLNNARATFQELGRTSFFLKIGKRNVIKIDVGEQS